MFRTREIEKLSVRIILVEDLLTLTTVKAFETENDPLRRESINLTGIVSNRSTR